MTGYLRISKDSNSTEQGAREYTNVYRLLSGIVDFNKYRLEIQDTVFVITTSETNTDNLENKIYNRIGRYIPILKK